MGLHCSRSRLAIASDGIPLAQVKRGDLDLKVHANGELNATHTMMLTAPAVGGGALQITRLLAGRLPVKKGDVVIEFDPSEQHYKLEQSRSELLQAEQEITKAKADAAVLKAQDKVALLKARYDVRASGTRCAEERDRERHRCGKKRRRPEAGKAAAGRAGEGH